MTPLSELTEMIRRGWGNVPQTEIPADWRDKPGPELGQAIKQKKLSVKHRRRIAKGKMQSPCWWRLKNSRTFEPGEIADMVCARFESRRAKARDRAKRQREAA